MPKRILINTCLVLVSLLVGLVVIELGLRLANFVLKTPRKYEFLVLEPHKEITTALPQKGLPGVEGDYTKKVNSQGFRGTEPSSRDFYRIVAIGGSTTECVSLNYDEAWPWLLQEDLIKRTGKRVWVGDVGVSGHQTRDHVYQVKYLLPQFPKTNAVILLVGINDLLMRIERRSQYNPKFLADPDNERYEVRRAFWAFPSRFWDFPKMFKVYHWWEKLTKLFSTTKEYVFDPVKLWPLLLRYRAQAKKLDRLPDMQIGLAEYERNLKSMIKDLKRYGIRPIFVTQPTLWREGLSPEEKNLLWLGFTLPLGSISKEYYSVSALRKGMDLYNRRLKKVCTDENVECVDLDAMLPRDTTVFFDDCHFNEAGSRKVAKLLCDYLASRPPFSGGR